MTKEKVLELACILTSGILQNPINATLTESYRTYDRINVVRQEAQALVALAQEMGIKIDE